MSTIVGYVLGALILLALYGLRVTDRIKFGHIPGPTPKWLVGSLFDFRKKDFLAQLIKQYGPVTKFFLGGRPNILIGSPELAKNLLAVLGDRDQLGGMVSGPQSRIEFEKALLPFAMGENAFRLRNSWMPAFHAKSLIAYETLMKQAIQEVITVIEHKMNKGEVIDIHKINLKMTMNVVGSTAFGIRFDLFKDEMNVIRDGNSDQEVEDKINNQLVKQMVEAVNVFFNFGRDEKHGTKKKSWSLPTPWFLFNLLFPELELLWKFLQSYFPSERKKRMLKSLDVGRKVGEILVENARQRIQSEESAEQTNFATRRGINPGSFLDIMITSQEVEDQDRLVKLKDYEIAAQAWTFILAGNETTASSLSFTIYCISLNPECESKLLQEIDSLNDPNYENIKSLQYLDCVIKEAMRLYSSVPHLNRTLDHTRMIGPYLIPKGSTIVVSTTAFHKDPNYWERPDEFYPERFLNNDAKLPMYIPFGVGSRMCLGQQFGMKEMKIAIAALYQKFTFKLIAGQVPLQTRETITQSPAKGVLVTAQPRL